MIRDMVKHKLRVLSNDLQVKSLKARVEIQKCQLKFKSASSTPQIISLAQIFVLCL